MATRAGQHFATAEQLLNEAEQDQSQQQQILLARAQVHATLACALMYGAAHDYSWAYEANPYS